MAYADQEMSGNRIIAIIIVALIHIAVGWLLVTGLAYEAFQEAVKTVTTVDIEEEEPPEPEETPEPPPEDVPDTTPPPIVAPPPPISVATRPPPVTTTRVISPPAPIAT
ncbi:MAG: energy transducer TonB, partial [Parerythrobacter sp.]